ncbi:protein NKG7 [Equus przewalskii]|uniref:Protein NKG7 n=1 Tax=Equus przewalskii TaxID=9798 RepID=A0ABM2F4L3_EQUPR|nr:PREDICTED: protein NKG7 [Equus przewalskii]
MPPMEPCRSLALLSGSLGLLSVLVALSTDFWFVAMGTTSSHSGLWPKEHQDPVAGYIHVTQAFSILASLGGLVSVSFLVLSCIPSLSVPGRGPLVSSVTAFAAAFFVMVAMMVYTIERWNQPLNPQIQTFFSWSFYLGWVSALFWVCAGALSLGAHCSAPLPGYEAV